MFDQHEQPNPSIRLFPRVLHDLSYILRIPLVCVPCLHVCSGWCGAAVLLRPPQRQASLKSLRLELRLVAAQVPCSCRDCSLGTRRRTSKYMASRCVYLSRALSLSLAHHASGRKDVTETRQQQLLLVVWCFGVGVRAWQLVCLVVVKSWCG